VARSFLVPDLSPEARVKLARTQPRVIFVAESPHTSEIEPVAIEDRRPLCGKAGKEWWKMVGLLLENESSEDTTLFRLLRICEEHQIAVLNAVQFPLDLGVAKKFPEADPKRVLGFYKGIGEHTYKKMLKSPELKQSLSSLKERLNHPKLAGLPIYALGLDSEWFLKQTFKAKDLKVRYRGRIPHPSAWWRRGGEFREQARVSLQQVFSELHIAP